MTSPTTTHQAPLTAAVPQLAPAITPPLTRPVMLTAAEVAELLRIDAYTVRRYVARGELPAYRIGRELRIDQADVLTYLAARRHA